MQSPEFSPRSLMHLWYCGAVGTAGAASGSSAGGRQRHLAGEVRGRFALRGALGGGVLRGLPAGRPWALSPRCKPRSSGGTAQVVAAGAGLDALAGRRQGSLVGSSSVAALPAEQQPRQHGAPGWRWGSGRPGVRCAASRASCRRRRRQTTACLRAGRGARAGGRALLVVQLQAGRRL